MRLRTFDDGGDIVHDGRLATDIKDRFADGRFAPSPQMKIIPKFDLDVRIMFEMLWLHTAISQFRNRGRVPDPPVSSPPREMHRRPEVLGALLGHSWGTPGALLGHSWGTFGGVRPGCDQSPAQLEKRIAKAVEDDFELVAVQIDAFAAQGNRLYCPPLKLKFQSLNIRLVLRNE